MASYTSVPSRHAGYMIPDTEESVKYDWSYKPKPPPRFFGRFRCQTCSKCWASAWTWQGRGQKCRNCTRKFGWDPVEYTFPFVVDPLMRRPPVPGPRKKPDHFYQNCEYCAELCGSTKKIPNRHACGKGRSGQQSSRSSG
eukprot:TRINITY_DN3211_c0_g1_i1.p1 TRINITY_DN3211_c0_g1~~TRINITY_DN3211_c0_g1_i1.p1  ORF type:complete len:151 (-),score=8.41 TRINITY_DN3211_c0_g1_i1:228-647(-)